MCYHMLHFVYGSLKKSFAECSMATHKNYEVCDGACPTSSDNRVWPLFLVQSSN